MKDRLLKSISNEFINLSIFINITSAKTGEGVDETFQKLASQMLMLE
jgi:hypothetical protein